MRVHIPASSVEVLAECDVLVCGGGCSGITAAVSAARHGAKVILLERWPFVGGMATAGLVTGWHRSDRRKMVIYGLVEEVARRAMAEGWMWLSEGYPRTHETHWFDPEGMKVLYQRMLDEAGVRSFCYTVAGEPVMEGGRIRGVLLDTKRGRRAVLCKSLIDATGDGDVATKAGAPFDFGRAGDGRVQGMTMMYSVCGIDEQTRAAAPPEKLREVHELMCRLSDEGRLPPFNHACGLVYMGNHTLPNMCAVAGDPLDEEELSRLTALGRERALAFVRFLNEHGPGWRNAKMEQTGCSLGIRESRRIRGLVTLDARMVLGAIKHPDAIGHGVWMVDIHDPKGSGYTTWNDRESGGTLQEGTSYHIPLGMCLNAQVPNLAVAGRCASSTHEGHSSVRVQTHCMVMGQGVGTLAALALAAGTDFAQVPVAELQATLKRDGVYLENVPSA